MEGLEAHTVEEYMLYDSAGEDQNIWVDISDFKERKITAMSKYVSQWSSGWYDYQGSELSEDSDHFLCFSTALIRFPRQLILLAKQGSF
ncbi:MAG: hypothetical protein KAR19_03860 [Bacteroidales bacterium]|nr:hypothetical protein [Bacteroidales bacterium]